MTINNKIISLEENQKELNTIMMSLQNEISTLKAQITNMHETFNNTLSLILRNNNNTNTHVTNVSSDESSSSDSLDEKPLHNTFEYNKKKNKKKGDMNRRRVI